MLPKKADREVCFFSAGIIFLKQKEDFLSEGYYIEYQIIDINSELNENDPWTKGNVIKNPSEDKKVIARLRLRFYKN